MRVAQTELDSQLRQPEVLAVLHAYVHPGCTPDDFLDALATALRSFARGDGVVDLGFRYRVVVTLILTLKQNQLLWK